MDINELKKLAGLEIVSEKQFIAKVETRKHPPEGLFATGSKAAIVKWLKDTHPEFKSAMSALNFYINRSGKGLSADRLGVLNSAKDALRAAYGVKESLEPFDMSLLRKMAGLSPVAEEEKEEGNKEESEEDEIPAIVTKIAAKAEGLKGDDMVDMISKVYDAGFKDGQAADEEDEATEVKESAENILPSFQVDGASHVGGIAIALADHGIEAFVVKGIGGVGHEYFFNFKNEADMNKGYEIAKHVGGALPPKPVAKPEATADAVTVAQ